MSRFDLSKHVAIVTGGNGGIGLAIAEGLAEQGCAVSIWGRNAGKNAAAVAGIQGRGGNAKAFRCDVSDRQQAERATRDTLDALAGSTAALRMRVSAEAGGQPSSSGPMRIGGGCFLSISMASSTPYSQSSSI